jgi:hypothetical protein
MRRFPHFFLISNSQASAGTHQFSENRTATPAFTVVIGNDCDVLGTVLR